MLFLKKKGRKHPKTKNRHFLFYPEKSTKFTKPKMKHVSTITLELGATHGLPHKNTWVAIKYNA